MQVAYVCLDPGVPVFGRKGCSVHVQETIREMTRQGVRVQLFAARTGAQPPGDLSDVALHKLPISQSGAAARERSTIESNRALLERLRAAGPFDFVYERYSLFSCSAMEYAREAGIPGLLEVNSLLIDEQLKHRRLCNERAARRATVTAFGAASSLLAVSEEVAAHLAAYPSAGTRIQVIPNGVDPSRFAPVNRSPARRGPFTVGFLGTLKPWHGVATLMDAFARSHFPDVKKRLLIVGDGPERCQLEQQVAELGIAPSVEFSGSVRPERVPALLASMDVAVAPYPDLPAFYFSPLKLFEYLAAGLPVVASRIGQISRLLTDQVHGLLCKPGDPRQFADAIERLQADPALRHRLAVAGRRRVVQEFTWRHVVQKILERARSDSLAKIA